MGLPSLSRILFFGGTILLLHASYASTQYRELLQELEESAIDETSFILSTQQKIPLDVWVEVIVGFMSLLVSELTRGGSNLRPIHKTNTNSSSTTRNKNESDEPLMAPIYRTRDFDIYSTRAKLL